MTVRFIRTRFEGVSVKTNIDAILEAESLLRNSEITETPRLEAEVLLADLLGIERAKLIASYSRSLAHPEAYFALIRRRVAGEPIAYITGKKEFMSFVLGVDRSTLIPRPETETLVEHIIETVGQHAGATMLDIGTGSGCIAIALALLMPSPKIHATDLYPDTVDRARKNAEDHGVGHRITFHVGDLYRALPDALKGRVDVIVSNPPYISDTEYAAIDPGIREFEPPAALRGGTDGLDSIRKIISGSPDYLAEDGILAVEVGADQGQVVADIFRGDGLFSGIQTVCDLAGHPRVITGKKTS